MRIAVLVVFLFCMTLFIQAGQAFRITNNLFFSMTNDTIKCIDVLLPDDAHFMGKGEFEYVLTSDSNWSDLTEQIVRTNENNTARIPICFSGFGRKIGECAPPFTIGLKSATLGISETWNGGVCISRFPDYDISDEEAVTEEDVRSILDGNVDLFDVGFSADRMYTEPGDNVIFSLQVQSYADLTIDLDVTNTNLDIIPRTETVTTSASDPYHTVYFTAQDPSESGEYAFDVEANARSCTGSFCDMTVTGTLIVNETIPQAGFSVSLFPKTINVKDITPVLYTMTIQNHGDAKIFSTRIDIRPVATTNFEWRNDVIVLDDSQAVINFTVTPKEISLHEVEVTVAYEGIEKKATSSLSTNEMLTDVMRSGDHITGLDPSLLGDVNSALDDWYNSYSSSDYGSDLGEYDSLKDSLADMRDQASQNTTVTPIDPGPYVPSDLGTNGEEDGFPWWIILVIVVAAIVVVIVIMFFRKSEKTDESEGEYY